MPNRGSKRVVALLATLVASPLAAQDLDISLEAEEIAAHATSGQGLLKRPANLIINGVPLYTALTDLQRRSGVSLVYSPSRLPLRRPVTCECYSLSVAEALDRMLAGTDLTYSVINEHILLHVDSGAGRQTPPEIAPPVFLAYASTRTRASPTVQATLQGQVLDVTTRQPIIGANVTVVGTQLGTITGADGRFQILNVPAGSQTVRVRMIGYGVIERTIELVTDQVAVLNFEISPEAVALAEIVAVGYGTQRRRDVTGAVASVDAARLESHTSVAQAIQGTAPGVTVPLARGAQSRVTASGSAVETRSRPATHR
jgi:hypothetical protein